MDAAFMASDIGRSRMTFPEIVSENPLPEERKEWCKRAFEKMILGGVSGIFESPPQLPPEDAYKTAQSPLTSLPIPVVSEQTGITQKDVESVMRQRLALEQENTRRETLHDRLVRDIKTNLAISILAALEDNAPLCAEDLRKAHVLVAATATMPAKYDGAAIFNEYRGMKGINDATRQDFNAENLYKELDIRLPNNCISSQLSVMIRTFEKKSFPHLLRPLSGALKVQFILGRMPESLVGDQRAIVRSMRTANTSDDPAEALRQACAAVDDAHDPSLGVPDVGAVILAHLHTLQPSRGNVQPSAAIQSYLSSVGTV